jgi:hypothetical protein
MSGCEQSCIVEVGGSPVIEDLGPAVRTEDGAAAHPQPLLEGLQLGPHWRRLIPPGHLAGLLA